jgi:anti-sigma factor RsiW
MNCQKSSREREVFLDYCAGSLEAARAAEFERHLAGCNACTAMVAAQREVWNALDRWGHAEAPEVSRDFDARLYARIAQEEAVPAWRKWLRRFMPAAPGTGWKPAGSMAAACAVVAIAVVSIQRVDLLTARAPRAVQNVAQMETDRVDARADHVDIELVANALDELDLLMPLSQVMPLSQGTPAASQPSPRM